METIFFFFFHNAVCSEWKEKEEKTTGNTKGKDSVIVSDIMATGEHETEQNQLVFVVEEKKKNECGGTQWQVIINKGAAVDTR